MRPNFKHQKQSAGFALIAAIFLVVVVGLAITYMQRLSSNQADVNIQAVQNARALEAAKSGLEWGVYRIVNGANCAPSRNFQLDQISTNISVTVACSSVTYLEAGVNVDIYTVTSTAEQGALGNPDYAYKRMQAAIEIPK